MAEFKGGIELISGIKPKNNQDFPLVRAQDVAFYENGEEIRLDEKIENLKSEFTISETTKQEIAGAATELVFDDARFETINTKIGKVDELDLAVTGEGGLKSRVETLEEKAKGDNDKLKIQYEESESLLYL